MKNKVLIIGLLCITELEAIALMKGINGVLLTSVIAAITGLVGLSIKTPKILEK